MTASELVALSPMIALGATAVALVSALAARRSHDATITLTLVGLAAALACLAPAAAEAPRGVGLLFVVDGYALALSGLLIGGAAIVAILSYPYLAASTARPEEYYILLVLATVGGVALVASRHFASLFLGLETLSVSLYGLIAYQRDRWIALEAGIKYLILAAVSSAILLFGIALVYAEVGGLGFVDVRARVAGAGLNDLALVGTALVITGLGFKLAVAPFHMWTPDVYQGAPAPVSALIATLSKGAVAGLALRLGVDAGAFASDEIVLVLAVVASLSMFAGNLLALRQDRVKRVLAYSSIAHLGYLLVAVIAAGELGVQAVGFYLVAYFLMTYLAFAVVTVLSTGERDADAAEDFRGLCWRRPLAGLGFVVSLLALAGMPLTAGFLAKFYVLTAGAGAGLWVLVVIVAVNSALGLFYYLRLTAIAIAQPRPEPGAAAAPTPTASGAVIAGLIAALVVLGIYPTGLAAVIARAAASM